ncbi:MAG: ATP-binding protein [Leptospiraceae bacterium]|nr:ATP-binding protein [Leptospiraceae bacterium]
MSSTNIQIKSQLSELRKLRKFTEDFYKNILEEVELDRVLLAIEEAVSNVILHGYKNNEEGLIEVTLSYSENEISICILDRAPFFNRNDLKLDLKEMPSTPFGGLGIHLMKKIMQIDYAPRVGGGNILIMKKTNYFKKK